jgi:hypothetical protein
MRLAAAPSLEFCIFYATPAAHLCLPVDPGVHLGEGLVEAFSMITLPTCAFPLIQVSISVRVLSKAVSSLLNL